MADNIEQSLLQALAQNGSIADTGAFATQLGVDHLAVVGVMKSLQASEMIVAEVRQNAMLGLSLANECHLDY